MTRASYDPAYLRDLFDEMAATYGLVNLVTSFGLSWWWRRQCVRAAAPRSGETVLDLMTGMGELLPQVARAVGAEGRITAVDFSAGMCLRAQHHRARLPEGRIEIREEDVLTLAAPSASADVIVSSFGLKTLAPEQIDTLAAQVARLLRPGGRFSFVEISVPPSRPLRRPYLFYLARVIPLLGRLLLGNPDNYRMLGIYTRAFGDSRAVASAFERAGLSVRHRRMLLGCATGVVGSKPGG